MDAIRNRPSNGILSTSALQVRTFIADLQPPMVSAFILDLQNVTLELTFDESVPRFDPNAIQIQNTPSNPTISYAFQDSILTSLMDNIAIIQLGQLDEDGLKMATSLATDTFVALLNGSAIDFFGNEVTQTLVSLQSWECSVFAMTT